jgi:superfamily II DNA or RNA helicase
MDFNIKILKKHQILPYEYMKKNRGLLLFHSTGSGKTVTALYSMYHFKNNIVIIGPKSSKKAFKSDIKKFKMDKNRCVFYTFSKIKRLIKENNIDLLDGLSVIVDEAHNLRNETVDNMLIISALELADKIILMTATPVINYLNDLSVLINIVKNKVVLPTDIGSFNAAYYDKENFKIINSEILKEKLKNCISYYKTNNDNSDFPEYTTIYKYVEMNNAQLDQYSHYIRKYIQDEKIGSITFKIDFDTIDARKKNFFLSGTRQLSNTINGNPEFPKIKEIYRCIKNGPLPCVIYSNYLENGVYALTPLLEKNNFTYTTITGTTTDEKIDKIVDNYNSNKYDVLLITSAGSESLDLKNTRQIHIMEPHLNESKISQVIGRAVRYKSHSSLPLNNRHVDIYRWCSVFPKTIHNKTADQYLIELSDKKNKILETFISLIESVSIENTK